MGRGEKGGAVTGEGGNGCINVPKRSSGTDCSLVMSMLWRVPKPTFRAEAIAEE